MESITSEIETIAKSDKVFSDNHDVLNAILNDATSMLNLSLDKTRFIQSSKSETAILPATVNPN